MCIGPVNLLLIGSGDLRHVMKTLTGVCHQMKRPLHVREREYLPAVTEF